MSSQHTFIIAEDSKMKKLLEVAESVASSRATILITGESGTGKELLARFIHAKSPRANKPFVAVNCAAVPEGLLESEMFGYEKGAFTNAIAAKPGRFELAHEGTLLLDEIAEMPLHIQAKLLRALQEGEIERVGSVKTTRVDVRVLASTNKNLEEMVRLGKFREDLYFRLNVVPLSILPLRYRIKDLEALTQHFLSVSCDSNGRPIKSLALESISKLKQYSWPGNARELQNVIERTVLLTDATVILPEHLSIDMNEAVVPKTLGPGMTVSEAEKLLIMNTLEYTSNNKTHAARLLGISVRTLRNKLHEYEGVIYE